MALRDGTKVGGALRPVAPPAEPAQQKPTQRDQVGVVESSTHRTGPFEPDQRSFKPDVNFSNSLSGFSILFEY